MAKRHRSLVPLARDHHESLILAVRLQQGTRATLKLWSHDPLLQAEYVLAFYEDHLKPHFRAEEEALFPLVKKNIPEAAKTIDQLVREHRSVEHYVGQLTKPHSRNVKSLLVELGKLLERHIRTEDRNLFPLIEGKASTAMLREAEKNLEKFYPKS